MSPSTVYLLFPVRLSLCSLSRLQTPAPCAEPMAYRKLWKHLQTEWTSQPMVGKWKGRGVRTFGWPVRQRGGKALEVTFRHMCSRPTWCVSGSSVIVVKLTNDILLPFCPGLFINIISNIITTLQSKNYYHPWGSGVRQLPPRSRSWWEAELGLELRLVWVRRGCFFPSLRGQSLRLCWSCDRPGWWPSRPEWALSLG